MSQIVRRRRRFNCRQRSSSNASTARVSRSLALSVSATCFSRFTVVWEYAPQVVDLIGPDCWTLEFCKGDQGGHQLQRRLTCPDDQLPPRCVASKAAGEVGAPSRKPTWWHWWRWRSSCFGWLTAIGRSSAAADEGAVVVDEPSEAKAQEELRQEQQRRDGDGSG